MTLERQQERTTERTTVRMWMGQQVMLEKRQFESGQACSVPWFLDVISAQARVTAQALSLSVAEKIAGSLRSSSMVVSNSRFVGVRSICAANSLVLSYVAREVPQCA